MTYRACALLKGLLAVLLCSATAAYPQANTSKAGAQVVAEIREEGFQRSQVMDIVSYMTDVLGARLTLSEDMKRAQVWAKGKMDQIGLVNTVIEPYMDYGVTWDNEYVSLHMLEPDYQPMVGYPIAQTPGTDGKQVLSVAIADIQSKGDMDKYKGKLKGMAVLESPPVVIDLEALAQATPRKTAEELKQLEESITLTPKRPAGRRAPRAPNSVGAEAKLEFFKAEGVAAVLQCEGGKLGAVRGANRPGSDRDHWSREGILASLPIIAITPEHYNRMYRILKRSIPVKIEVEVRNRIGEKVEKAANVLGEITGSDLKDEVVMIGAHFDTWQASPNASDNTSGCAVVLEAARILGAIAVQPRRTIRVALWSGEEQGLHGSHEYVLKHFGNPKDPKVGAKPEYEKFSVYFNQDYGAGAFRGICLQGNEFARGVFAGWMEPLRNLGFTAISIQSLGSTDHESFDGAGLPGFQFIQDRIPGTAGHTNLDFLETLQAEDLMKNAVIMAVFAYDAAMSDERMPRKTIR
jgi:F0F1-type ATP synthase membrane subunit c/vacuolar-type H+-ATPase subunit K